MRAFFPRNQWTFCQFPKKKKARPPSASWTSARGNIKN